MDPITHGLLGAATAQVGFRQKIGRDATWVAAVTALLPDLDLFISPLLALTGAEVGEEADSMLSHRGLSHSLLIVPLLALLVAAMWWKLRRPRRENGPDENAVTMPAENIRKSPSFRLLYLCVFVAAITHPLLDWCTSYGTQIFAPLTNHRYAFDAIPIVDIFFTPLLALTLLACYIARKVHGGRSPYRQAPRASLIIGWTGVLLGIGYIAAGRVLHGRAIDKAMETIAPEARGQTVLRADAYPAMGSIFLWRAVIQTDKGWYAVRVHHFSRDSSADFPHKFAPDAKPNALIKKAEQSEEYKKYEWFTGGRIRVEYADVPGGHVVTFHDMRYAQPLDSVDSHWPLVAQFDAGGELRSMSRMNPFGRRRGGMNMSDRAKQMFDDLFNP